MQIWYNIYVMNNDNTLTNPSNEQLLDKIKELEEQVLKLQRQHEYDAQRIKYLDELLSLRTKELFARKAEKVEKPKSPIEGDQLKLFDDIELTASINEVEEKVEQCEEELAKATNKKPRKKRKNIVNFDSLKEVVVRVKPKNLPENAEYVGCKEKSVICKAPAVLYKQLYKYEIYKVVNADGTITFYMAEPEGKDTAFSNTMFDPSVVSDIIYNKTVLALPLYRQEQDFKRTGIDFPRQTMSSLIYKGYNAILPISNRIANYIKTADNCRADETRLFIIESNGDKARIADPKSPKISYIWLFMTAEGYHKAFSYVVGPTRKYENARNFFDIPIQHRFLQTDDYGAYDNLPNTDRIPCLVHTRRKFFDSMSSSKKPEYITYSQKFLDMISAIHNADNQVHKQYEDKIGQPDYYDLIKEQRLITVKPLMDDFYNELETFKNRVLPQSLFKTAINYALGHKKLTYNFFLDGRLTLGNNDAERNGIKPLVIGRKNWLFANTEKGAAVTCAMYSIVETALANGLNPRAYLEWLFRNLPYHEMKDFNYEDFMPWSDKIPENIKSSNNK